MRTHQWPTVALCLTLLATSMAGCTSWHSVPATTDGARAIALGDRILVETRDGKTLDMRLTALDETHISGRTCDTCAPQSVALSDIVSLDARQFSALKTTGLVVGLFVLGRIGGSSGGGLAPGL